MNITDAMFPVEFWIGKVDPHDYSGLNQLRPYWITLDASREIPNLSRATKKDFKLAGISCHKQGMITLHFMEDVASVIDQEIEVMQRNWVLPKHDGMTLRATIWRGDESVDSVPVKVKQLIYRWKPDGELVRHDFLLGRIGEKPMRLGLSIEKTAGLIDALLDKEFRQ